jgi:hypothetical protein
MKHIQTVARTTLLVLAWMTATPRGFAQIANPADAMRDQAPATQPPPMETRYRTWEYPVIQVKPAA